MDKVRSLEYVSGSSIQAYHNCKLRWCYAWLENRVPRKTPQALTVGKMVHQAFEDHFNIGMPVSDALKEMVILFEDSILTDTERKAYIELQGLVEPLKFWEDSFPIEETLEVETPFEFDLFEGIKFRGRPDRVVVCFGKVFHWQLKTLGATRDIGSFIHLAQRSFHELIYGWYLEQKYCAAIGQHMEGRPIIRWSYGGTLYSIIKKLKYRRKPQTKAEKDEGKGKIINSPESMFLQCPVAISPGLQKIALEDLNAITQEMIETARIYENGGIIPSNRGMDAGIFGNHADPYVKVMMGEASLEDDGLFQDRDDPYEKEEK